MDKEIKEYTRLENLNKTYTIKTYRKGEVAALFVDLYEQVKHGDDEHKEWLKKEIVKFVNERVLNDNDNHI